MADVRKYRKRPVEVEAFGPLSAEPTHDENDLLHDFLQAPWESTHLGVLIQTREGSMLAMPGDYIVREPFPTADRRYYPVKPSVFTSTYTPVEEGES